MIERVLNVVTAGLRPPVPLELRSDYVQATPEKQAEMRLSYAKRTLRQARIIAALLGVLAINSLWQFGILASFGLGSGTARATEVDKVRAEITATNGQIAAVRADAAAFRIEDKRDKLNQQLRTIKAEEVQIRIAVSEAHARGEQPLRFLVERLGELDTQRSEVVRKLQQLPPPPAE